MFQRNDEAARQRGPTSTHAGGCPPSSSLDQIVYPQKQHADAAPGLGVEYRLAEPTQGTRHEAARTGWLAGN